MARTTEVPPDVKENSRAVHPFLEVLPRLHSHFLFLEVQEVLEDLAHLGPLSVLVQAAGMPRTKTEIVQVSPWNLYTTVQ